MKKTLSWLLPALTCIFSAFCLGLFLGRSVSSAPVLVSIPQSSAPTAPATEPVADDTKPDFPININTAGRDELMLLPGIGETFADRIVQYRERNGSFRRAEDLMNIDGIGPKTLESILELITVGGLL